MENSWITPSDNAWNLGVVLQNHLSHSAHVATLTWSCRFLLWPLRSLCNLLSSRDWNNAMHSWLVFPYIAPNPCNWSCSTIALTTSKLSHVIPLFFSVPAWIRFKILILTYKAKKVSPNLPAITRGNLGVPLWFHLTHHPPSCSLYWHPGGGIYFPWLSSNEDWKHTLLPKSWMHTKYTSLN